MNKEIKFTGLSTSPSDYESPDGALAVAMNLLNEDGSLSALLPPARLFSLPKGSSVKYIHKTTSGMVNYIILNADGSLCWKSSDKADIIPLPTATTVLTYVTRVDAIGNTLLIFTPSSIIYYLWKEEGYKELGDALPDLQLSFGLIGRPRLYSVSDDSKSKFKIEFDKIPEQAIFATFSEDNKTKITSQVMAKVNKFIANETIRKGRFCLPFMVRYALRLYDGTLTRQSAPILMNPSTVTAPVVIWDHMPYHVDDPMSGQRSISEAELDIMLVAASLDYQVIPDSAYGALDNWSDIVKGVEVYISKPIYTFDQNGNCENFADSDNFATKFIGRLYNSNRGVREDKGVDMVTEDKFLAPVADRNWETLYAEWEYSHIYALYFSKERKYPPLAIHLPEFSEDKVSEAIRDTTIFYKLCSLDLTALKTAATKRTEITVEDDYLQALLTRETLMDDYLSHERLVAKQSFVYNSRLNLADLKRRPFTGFYLGSMLAYKNADINWEGDAANTTLKITASHPEVQHNYSVTVYIKENERDYAVSSSFNGYLGNPGFALGRFFSEKMNYSNLATQQTSVIKEKHSWGTYLYYPNVNAYRMVIQDSVPVDDGAGGYKYPRFIIDLQPHEFLNGAYALLDYERVVDDNYEAARIPQIPVDPSGKSNYIEIPSKLYTSEINNPFHFPLTNINTVGTGRIIGISSAAKALSQGQFGQFPLYAFTDEGVWALSVTNTGGFSAIQPITRDVCISPDSITQIDSAVLFAAARGVMVISGSQTQCISDSLDSRVQFDADGMPGLYAVCPDLLLNETNFIDYLKESRMIYDYVNQRVIIFRVDRDYSYIYSLRTKQWGMQRISIGAALNSYPDALAMEIGEESDYLVDVTSSDVDVADVALISRPIKFDAPDVLKTVSTTIVRGLFPKTRHAQLLSVLLYGTRDYLNWHLISTSRSHAIRTFRGSPYKAFRIVVTGKLSKGHTISGGSFEVVARFNNKLR